MTESFFVLCAAVAAVSALLAFLCYRRSRQLVEELRLASSQIRSANLKSEATEARVEELADAFLRLRGKFYATRRESQSESLSSDGRAAPIASATSAAAPNPNDPAQKLAWKAMMRERMLVPKKQV